MPLASVYTIHGVIVSGAIWRIVITVSRLVLLILLLGHSHKLRMIFFVQRWKINWFIRKAIIRTTGLDHAVQVNVDVFGGLRYRRSCIWILVFVACEILEDFATVAVEFRFLWLDRDNADQASSVNGFDLF